MSESMEGGNPKKHRKSKSGAKANKIAENKLKKSGKTQKGDKKSNPKAFSVANVVRTKRTQQRNLDRQQKKELVPLVDREEELPPPCVIVVMGPQGVGKSTLIRSLVKMYTKQNLADTKGPITVIAGKKKRLTFFECPLDIHSMTDMAKVADLVLLMIDASYGYEMETFEYLNQLQLHGFPKVVGILTHLDGFRQNKLLQNTKKALKHRFWTEIYKGAKMFDMSGIINNKYLKHEVKRLSLYISRIKFRPLVWRNTHPFILVDRVEDVTTVTKMTENPACDRDITLYGYVRGTHLKPSQRVHLIGAGDFDISAISAISDPCQISNQNSEKKTLKTKDNLLYAPMANVGRVTVDKDGMYIEIKDIHYTKPEQLLLGDQQSQDYGGLKTSVTGDTPVELLRSMQDKRKGVDVLMKGAEMSLFEGSAGIKSYQVKQLQARDGADADDGYDNSDVDDDSEHSDDEDEDDELDDEVDEDEDEIARDDEMASQDGDKSNAEDSGDNEQSDDEEDNANDEPAASVSTKLLSTNTTDNSGANWKRDMQSKAADTFKSRQASHGEHDIMAKVYGKSWAAKSSKKTEIAGQSYRRGGNGEDDDDDADYDAEDYDNDDNDDNDDDANDDLFVLKSSSTRGGINSYQASNAVDTSRVVFNREDIMSRFAISSTASSSIGSMGSRMNFSGEHALSVEKKVELLLTQMQDKLQLQQRVCSEGQKGLDKTLLARAKKLHSSRRTGVASDSDDSESDEDVDGANADDEGDYDGDFEDLQTGQKYRGSKLVEDDEDDNEFEYGDDNDVGGDSDDNDDEDADSEVDMDAANDQIDAQLRAAHAARKATKKSSFDADYDNKKTAGKDGEVVADEVDSDDEKVLETAKRLQEELRQRNRAEFGEEGEQSRISHEGYRQGLYVRILIRNVPAEFSSNFRPHLPTILGGLMPHEMTMGYIRARVKKHRWHKRILKSNDPIIFSIGWRRFQSLPVFTTEDPDERSRFLKYTPEHMHCICTFYGPLVPPNTGVLAFQNPSSSTNHQSGFRIALTGATLESEATPTVVKKLKLVGTPQKVFKNTAFITGMFNSSLEVAKFEGAKLKTVSGIRGQIKKALKDGEPGRFRATFEDKILMSDIIICRLWINVELKKYYNPVQSLLVNDVKDWQAMRTTAQIRREEKIPLSINKDSVYKPIERTPREFRKLKVSSHLQASLPFASKPKNLDRKNGATYAARRAVVLEPGERKERAAVQVLSTIRADKLTKRHDQKVRRLGEKEKIDKREMAKFEPMRREEAKRKFRDDGKKKSSKKSKN